MRSGVAPQPAVPQGQSRKLHCPWTDSFTVVKRFSDVAYQIQDSRPKKRHTRVVVHLDQLKLCPPSMRGVDGGVRSNCHRSSVSHSRVTNVPPPAGAHLIVDVEESDTEDSGPPPLPTDLREESEGGENSNSLDETEVPAIEEPAERRYPLRHR